MSDSTPAPLAASKMGDDGLDLPTGPGVWEREREDWTIVVRLAGGAEELLIYSGFTKREDSKFIFPVNGGVHDLPRGGWHQVVAEAGEVERLRAENERLRDFAQLTSRINTAFPDEAQRDQAYGDALYKMKCRAEDTEAELADAKGKLADFEAWKNTVRSYFQDAGIEGETFAHKMSELVRGYKRAESAERELAALRELVNCPHNDDWFEGVRIEAAHQQERWGAEHDDGKEPSDWFWLIGYLAGKCLRACIDGNIDKAKHHTISTAAVLLNWYRRISGESWNMRPGIPSFDNAEGVGDD